MTTVRYFIPEDGDSEAHPNVFLAPKSNQPGYPPSLGQVREAFPLPGRYHFRFKAPLVPGSDREKGGLAVWMDCVDDSEPVRVWRNSIIAKVTRIGVDDDSDDEDEDFPVQATATATSGVNADVYSHTSSPAGSATHTPRASPPPQSENFLDVFDDPAPASTSSSPSSHAGTANLIDVDGPSAAAASHGGSGGDASLLDMGGYSHVGGAGQSSGGHSHGSSAHDDLLGMSATATSPPQQHQHRVAPQHNYGHHQQRQPHPSQHQQQSMNSARMNSVRPNVSMQSNPRQPPSRSGSGVSNTSGSGKNAFDTFSSTQNKGPFSDLSWT